MPGRDLAAQLRRHRLLAIANAEDWYPGGQERIRHARRAFVVDRGWAARKNHRFRRQLRERLFGVLDGRDLAIDARLADAPRDQLRHLRSEIDDQNFVVMQDNAVMEWILRHR
jgi:hypothetical protein